MTTRESICIMSETAIEQMLDNWNEEHILTKEEALDILNLPDDKLDKLISTAYGLRLKYKGKKVSIQLLTNVRSGNCSQNCAYCAQSCESHADIEKYRRVSDEKLYGDNDLVDEKHLARHCIGLSGISFTDAEIEDLAERIRKMKKNDLLPVHGLPHPPAGDADRSLKPIKNTMTRGEAPHGSSCF